MIEIDFKSLRTIGLTPYIAQQLFLYETNLDVALLVMGLDQDFNLRRMERYLAIVQAAQVTPVIVLTKADIAVNLKEKLDAIQPFVWIDLSSPAER